MVRSKFHRRHRRAYAHSYHVCTFEGSIANSVGGESGQDRRTESGDQYKSVRIMNYVERVVICIIKRSHV